MNAQNLLGDTALHRAIFNPRCSLLMVNELVSWHHDEPPTKKSQEGSWVDNLGRHSSTGLREKTPGPGRSSSNYYRGDCQPGHHQELVVPDINVNAVNFKGETPLHYAAQLGRLDIVSALLKADCMLTDRYIFLFLIIIKPFFSLASL